MARAEEMTGMAALFTLIFYFFFYYWVFSAVVSGAKAGLQYCDKNIKIDNYLTTDLFCEEGK